MRMFQQVLVLVIGLIMAQMSLAVSVVAASAGAAVAPTVHSSPPMNQPYVGAVDKLTACSGGEGGQYERTMKSVMSEIGPRAKKVLGHNVDVKVINTGGSLENVELLNDGTCQIAIMQADVANIANLPPKVSIVDAHEEVVYWLYSLQNDVSDFGTMENSVNYEKFAIATVEGAGVNSTLANFVREDEDYKNIQVVEFSDWYDAAEAVANGYTLRNGKKVQIAGMLYTGMRGVISSDITEQFAKKIGVGELDDSDFHAAKDRNGSPLYKQCQLTGEDMAGLTDKFLSDQDTVCMRAQVVVNEAVYDDLPKPDAKKLRKEVKKSINKMVSVTGGGE